MYSLWILGLKILSKSSRREREGHPCHLQEEVRALPNKTTLFSCFLDTNPHQWLLKTIPPHVAPDTTSTRHTQPHPFGKTTHLSKERKHHRDHMVEVLIRSWGCSMRQGDGTTPTLPSTEVSAVPHGLALGRGAFRRCAVFLSRAAGERGRPDTFGVLQRACYVIMWSNRKVLMTERGEVGGVFLLWWLSAR